MGLKETTIVNYCWQLGIQCNRRNIIDKEIRKSVMTVIERETKNDTPENKLRDLYALGIMDIKVLMKKTGLSMNDINKYISNISIDEQEMKRKKILMGLVEELPMDLAKHFNINPCEVYDIIDGITEIGRQEICIQALKKRKYIYEKIAEMKKRRNEILVKILKKIESKEDSDKGLLQLSEICYTLGAEKACQRIAGKVEKNSNDENVRNLARDKRESYKQEFLIRDIRKRYKEGMLSYDMLVKIYDRTYIGQVIGKEERDR